MPSIQNFLWFAFAALLEIAGCYAAWMWLRLGRSAWWLVPGTISLVLFAIALTRVDTGFAGRAFAAYGGVYIVGALGWLMLVERVTPKVTDIAGAIVCLLGAAIIVYGERWVSGLGGHSQNINFRPRPKVHTLAVTPSRFTTVRDFVTNAHGHVTTDAIARVWVLCSGRGGALELETVERHR